LAKSGRKIFYNYLDEKQYKYFIFLDFSEYTLAGKIPNNRATFVLYASDGGASVANLAEISAAKHKAFCH
jgi:hypothetical protein